jgi:hypothetical protein
MASLKRLSPFAQPLNPKPEIRLAYNCFSYPIYWNSGLEVEITLFDGSPDLHAPLSITENDAIIIRVFTGSWIGNFMAMMSDGRIPRRRSA